MKALGLLSLLLALVIVTVLARKQLTITHQQPASNAAASAVSSGGIASPQARNAEEARQVEQRVQDDMNRMMQERASEVDRGVDGADKP